MIYEHCSSLTFFFTQLSSSTGYTIQTHIRFTSCFHRVFVDMFENKSKSVNILILLFYICPSLVHRGTPISYVLQFFH